MHIETLKIFCDLAQLRSFSKTADKNLVSQSAVSQQLAQLELAHKCQLLDRTKRPMELTPAGELFCAACKDIIDRYEKLKSQINSLQKSSVNKITVAAIFSIGMHVLNDYVKQFMIRSPDVKVQVEYSSADKIYEQVLAGEIDIGLVAIPKRDRRLEVYNFQNEPLVLVCSLKNPLANETEIDIHKIQFERFIAFDRNVPTREWVDNILRQFNITIRPVMEFDNTETIKRAVEINSGVSILPRTTIAQELANGTVKAIEFANEHFVRPTGIILRKDKIRSQACNYFIDMLRAETD